MKYYDALREVMLNYVVMLRPHLEFRGFFNAGIDKETGIVDGEGCDVIYVHPEGTEQLVGQIYGYHPLDIAAMDDDEFREALSTAYRPYVQKPEDVV